ncbi:MAG: ABC transporter ATP-binding protein [Pseudomonadota bacterium]
MGMVTHGLSKSFDDHIAVDEVSLRISENAFCVVVGASGCGKSTLLRLIAGLETPDEGDISLSGAPVVGPDVFVPPEERRVGVVFQSYALWPHLTVRENVAFPYEARGMRRRDALAKADEHLKLVSLEDFRDRKPEALSGGQRQRVALARSLAGDARTILMDEPLANLDPHLRAEMESELRAFHDRSGVTTLYITHDQREAMALADVMAVMDAGRILQFGPPEEVYNRPATRKVAGFIGRGALVTTSAMGGRAQISGQEVPVEGGAGDCVFLRPHNIAVRDEGAAARVETVRYRGGFWEADASVEGLTERVQLDLHRPVRVGETLRLTFTGGWVVPD